MDLELALRRTRLQTLTTTVLVALLSGFLVYSSYRLQSTNAELREAQDRLVEISRMALERRELDARILEQVATGTQDDGITAEQYYILGTLAFAEEQYGDAELLFTRSITRRPDWPDVYLARGRTYSAVGDHDSAVSDLSSGIDLADYPHLYAARCFSLMRLLRLDDALEDCNYAIDNSQNDWVPFNYRGFVNYMLEEDEGAIADWTRAAGYRLQPQLKAESLENIGLVHLRTRDWQLALNNANQVYELWSESPWNCLFRGIAARELGDEVVADDALTCWRDFARPADHSALRFYLPDFLQDAYLGPE